MKGFNSSANAERKKQIQGHVVPIRLIFVVVQTQSVESLMLLRLFFLFQPVVFPFRVDDRALGSAV